MPLPLEPEQVHALIRGMEAARSIHYAGAPPDVETAAAAIRRAARQGMSLTFHHVLTDEGHMVWEARVDTGRGTLVARPDEDHDWTAVFEGLGIA